MNCIWLVIDHDGRSMLPSELTLVKVDVRLAPSWYKEKMSEWPKYSVRHSEVLGLALQDYLQKHDGQSR
jgi:hypothetical protein